MKTFIYFINKEMNTLMKAFPMSVIPSVKLREAVVSFKRHNHKGKYVA